MQKQNPRNFLIVVFVVSLASFIPLSGSCKIVPSEETTSHDDESGAHGGKPHSVDEINWWQIRFAEGNPPLIANFFNLAVMVFILWYLSRKAVTQYFKERSKKIKDSIEESENMKKEAEEKYARISERLGHIEEEMEAMKKELIAAAVAENEKVISEARSQADLIRNNTLRLIEMEKEVMLEKLKREIADKVVERAQKMVKEKIKKSDHDRITKETMEYYTEKM